MTWIWNCCLCKPVIVILAPHSCRLTPLLLDCITLNLHACTCLYRCGVRMCSYSTCPFYLTVFSRLVGGCGERAILLHSSALAAANVESWLEGHTAAAGPAALALAGSDSSAGNLKNALLRRNLFKAKVSPFRSWYFEQDRNFQTLSTDSVRFRRFF